MSRPRRSVPCGRCGIVVQTTIPADWKFDHNVRCGVCTAEGKALYYANKANVWRAKEQKLRASRARRLAKRAQS